MRSAPVPSRGQPVSSGGAHHVSAHADAFSGLASKAPRHRVVKRSLLPPSSRLPAPFVASRVGASSSSRQRGDDRDRELWAVQAAMLDIMLELREQAPAGRRVVPARFRNLAATLFRVAGPIPREG